MKASKVELVYFSGCPNVTVARDSIRSAMEEAGRDPEWVEWDVHADDTPARYRGFPSPTVLVSGRDVLGSGAVEGGVSCRAGGAPSPTQILAAFRGAR